MLGRDADRTIPATRRQREQARDEGHVVQSRILTTGILLILFCVTSSHFGEALLSSVIGLLRSSLSEWSIDEHAAVSIPAQLRLCQSMLLSAATWGFVLLLGAAIAVLVQTRGWFRPRFVLPKGTRLSPMNNVRRSLGGCTARVPGAALAAIVALCIVSNISFRLYSGVTSGSASTRAEANAWVNALESGTIQIGIGCLMYGLIDLYIRLRRRDRNLQMTPAEWEEEQRSASRGAS